MKRARVWSATVYISETDDVSTTAEVRLKTVDGLELSGHGRALHNPLDIHVPEIGDELAVARALADLSVRLLRTTTSDIEGVSHKRVHLTS